MRNPICKDCKRCEAATNVCVYGHTINAIKPDIMVVIDNINQAQDQTQSLMMGQGGTVLLNLLNSAGIMHRSYITAAVKCSATHKPNAKEIRACRKYLLQEIDEVKPKLIIAMGSIAVRGLFDKTYSLKELRQRFFDAFNTQVACTFSHNIIFTDPTKLSTVTKDLQWIMTNWNKPLEVSSEYQLLQERKIISSGILTNVLGIDIESTGLNPYSDNILTLAIANPNAKESIGYNISHQGGPEYDAFESLDTVIGTDIFDKDKTLVGHNIKFDIKMIEQSTGIKCEAKLIDTSIAHAMLDENSVDNNLQSLSAIYTPLGHYWDELDKTNLANEPYEKVIKNNQYDAIVPLMLMEKFYPELKKQGLLNVFNFVSEMIPIFAEIEQTGVKINLNKLVAMQQKNELISNTIINKYPKINLASGPQVADVIYKQLGCPVIEQTKGGKPSTSKDTLNALKTRITEQQEFFIDDVLEVRRTNKISDHLAEILEHTNANRVRTTYNLAKAFDESGTMRGAVTGRLSSSEANLQNKPPEIRELFEVSDGYNYFVTGDYSQIELRVAAFLSREPNLIKAFNEGRDVHTSVMCDIVGQDYNRIYSILRNEEDSEYKKWHDYRLAVKRVNFGIVYGIQANHLVKLILQMGVKLTADQCKEIIQKWYAKNPVLMQWIRNTEDKIIIDQQYRTITGRIRHLPGASRRSDQGHRALRQGINFPIQSAASDICLTGIKNLYNCFKSAPPEYKSRLLMTVHDEISYETVINNTNMIEHITRRMLIDDTIKEINNRFGIRFDIPLDIDIKIGKYWKK